jgi:hypothetical protein
LTGEVHSDRIDRHAIDQTLINRLFNCLAQGLENVRGTLRLKAKPQWGKIRSAGEVTGIAL